jgi:hypothetical protein
MSPPDNRERLYIVCCWSLLLSFLLSRMCFGFFSGLFLEMLYLIVEFFKFSFVFGRVAHACEWNRFVLALAEHTTVALHQGVIKRHCSGWPTLWVLVHQRVGSASLFYAEELEKRDGPQRSALHHVLLTGGTGLRW